VKKHLPKGKEHIMLKSSQVALFIVLGIIFWFVGMMTIRIIGPVAFTPNNPLVPVAYLASFPMLFGAIYVLSLVSRIPLNQMLQPTVIMTFAAIFIDGVVIAWMPEAYGADTYQVMIGAAWLLWGGAAGLLIAWLFSLRVPRAA
jgi:hypothetical protein